MGAERREDVEAELVLVELAGAQPHVGLVLKPRCGVVGERIFPASGSIQLPRSRPVRVVASQLSVRPFVRTVRTTACELSFLTGADEGNRTPVFSLGS